MLAQALPPLVGDWEFDDLSDSTGNFDDITLKGAALDNGALDVDSGKWAYAGGYTGPDIGEKTLVSWVSLDDLNVRAGSAITIDRISSDHFDGIIYAERQERRWMAGSSGFQRTDDAVPGYEETEVGELHSIAISYADDGGTTHVSLYRNGDPIGDYTKGGLSSWQADDAEVFFGLRHGSEAGGGPGNLDAHIERARIYNGVLAEAEIREVVAVESRGKLATLWGAMKEQ
jgi:hypothetical protein